MVSRISLCMALVGLFAASAVSKEAAAPDGLQDALVAQETKLINAINKKDKAAIDELLADQVAAVTSRGRENTKQVIESLKRTTFSKYAINNPQAFAVSDDVAILTYTFPSTEEQAGQPRLGANAPKKTTVYATSVWKQTDGQWRSIFYQESPVAK